MPTATPETLVDVVREVFVEAQKQAAGEFEDILDQIEHDAEDGWTALENLVHSKPDWSTLLLLILTKIHDLDPDHITAGTMVHPAWKRLLTLAYRVDTPVSGSILLGLALTEPDAAHGIRLQLTGHVDEIFGLDGGLLIHITSDGDVTWDIPFGAPMKLPKQAAKVDVEVSWSPGLDLEQDGVSVKVGPLSLRAHLDTATLSYQTTFGLGTPEIDGVRAGLDIRGKLSFLSEIVDIAPVNAEYSPNVRLATGQSPSFSLMYHDD